MAEYKFAAGDKVALMTNSSNVNVRAGIYTIVRRMPVSSLRSASQPVKAAMTGKLTM